MKKILGNYVVDAIALIILGIILLVRPNGTLSLICKLFGIVLLVMGAAKIIGYYSAGKDPMKAKERSTGRLLIAVVQAVFGLLLLINPGLFIGFIPFVAGIIIGYGAIVSLVNAMRLNKYHAPGASVSIILSVVTLVLAILIILNPTLLSDIFVQVVGISLIVEGVTMLSSVKGKKQ